MKSQEFQMVQVAVPAGRVPEFYEMFGRWLAGNSKAEAEASTGLLPFAEGVPTVVSQWWGTLSSKAKRLFLFLQTSPGIKHSGIAIAEACDIANGSSGVAGTLSWPVKYARDFGLDYPLIWDRESQEYSMTPEVATLIRQAQALAGASA
jgi:Family of unknown function (DUF6416)